MTPAGFEIRHAVEADCAAIACILDHEMVEGYSHFGTGPEGDGPVIESWLRDRAVYPWMVATDPAGGVLGFARAGPWKSRSAYDWTCETGVYVAGPARGRGLGKMLYRNFVPELQRRGFRCIVAGVALPNPASERLHESVGMTVAGTLDLVGYKHGGWRSVRYYTMRLGDGGPPGPSPRLNCHDDL